MTDVSETSALGARLAMLRDMRGDVLYSLVVILSLGATVCVVKLSAGQAPSVAPGRMLVGSQC